MSLEKSWTLGKLFSSGINQIPSYFLTLLPSYASSANPTHPVWLNFSAGLQEAADGLLHPAAWGRRYSERQIHGDVLKGQTH